MTSDQWTWRAARVERIIKVIRADAEAVPPGTRLTNFVEYRRRLRVDGTCLSEARRHLIEEGVIHFRPGIGTFTGPRPDNDDYLPRPKALYHADDEPDADEDPVPVVQKTRQTLLGKPVVTWRRVPVEDKNAGALFLVLCRSLGLYDIYRLEISATGTRTAHEVAQGLSRDAAKEKFEKWEGK